MEEKRRKNPYLMYESILRALNAERIERVRNDQLLIRNGWQIYFAIDPYDIGKFCFPFSPTSLLSQFSIEQIEDIARLQNGRYEAIYRLSTRPILLEPYIEEIEATNHWARWSKYVPTKSDLLDRYLALLRVPSEKQSTEVRKTLKELTEKDISSLVAIVTGIVSIGFERLNDVLINRLVRGSPNGSHSDAYLNLSSRDQVSSMAFQVFENYFKTKGKAVFSPSGGSKWMQRSREIIRINNRRDALAVDQLLQLNEVYNPKKCLVLYLSSSPKSAELFGPSGIPRPIIDNKPYDLVRTARDLFIYMIYRGDQEDPVKNATEAVEKLSELDELINNVGRIRDKFKTASLQCDHCNRDESLPLCEFGSHCEGVLKQGEHIAQRQEANINLSMQKKLAQAIEVARANSKNAKDGKYDYILTSLSELLKDKPKLKVINQEMEVNLQSSITKMRFVSAFVTAGLTDLGLQVSCYLNYYPVRLEVTDKGLSDVVDGVVRILPKASWSIETFHEYVGRYLKIDATWEIDAESELVRSFLYSIMGRNDKAKQIVNRYLNGGEKTDDRILKEFRYLQCFILWHTNEFKRAIEAADAGIKKYKRDGRFYHGRSIIIIDLLTNETSNTNDYAWKDVVEAAKQAIEMFTKAQDSDMVAVNYNNLAWAYSSQKLAGLNPGAAEQHLNELIRRIPETQWDPNYPEFFHTKGSVLLAKFLTMKEPSMLINAYTSALKAFKLFPEKSEHRELKESIEKQAAESKIQLLVVDSSCQA
jgi:tetratricopeptide (TPR) repeat protein